jgi:N-methylhydantoinase A/acetophenone carboxylase|tara:strand:- start:5760 stop:7919 length:2160 start_codon:yes stop_codon:yes gene_type:complete
MMSTKQSNINDIAVDLDIGGTFTDCFVTYEGGHTIAKSSTTRYDVSVGAIRAIETAAATLDLELEQLLARCESVRYSTTISMNTLIERSGPKLGMIATAGFEDTTIIGRARSWVDGRQLDEVRNKAAAFKPKPLIPRDMIVGVKERLDWSGSVLQKIDRDDVIKKVHQLVDQGAMGFVVSLLWSFQNPVHEIEVREIIDELYPEKYLGAMPVLLSSEISSTSGEYPRTMATILSSYIHYDLSHELRSLGDELRNRNYTKPILLVNNTGAVSKVVKTPALNTYASGPVAGLLGGARLCEHYGISNAVLTDMGGTSFDASLVVDGNPRYYAYHPVIENFFVSLPMLEVSTIGAGGGSIAWINPLTERLEVGPRSAGAMPGPACYNLGGREPTVTDADLVLGYLNPERFCGGQLELDMERARMVIATSVAGPLGLEVPEAAQAIKQIVDGRAGNDLFKNVALRGLKPEDFAVFAFGGAGATHAVGYSNHLGAGGPIYVFRFSPVFCAFGSAVSDIAHVYQTDELLPVLSSGVNDIVLDSSAYNRAVDGLFQQAHRGLEEDGFDPKKADYILELEMRYGSQIQNTVVQTTILHVDSEEDIQRLADSFTEQYIELWGPGSAYPAGGVEINLFRLRASIPSQRAKLPKMKMGKSDPSESLLGTREAWWDSSFAPTPVYDLDQLTSGNVVVGPGLAESDATTLVIPPGWECQIDEYETAVLRLSEN